VAPLVVLALIALSSALSVNNIVAALALGLGGIDGRDRIRVAVVFGTTSLLAPVIGVLIGAVAASHVGAAGRYVGGGILLAIAIDGIVRQRQLFSSVKDLRHLIATGASVNLDSLVSGVALAVGQLPVVASVTAIAVITTAFSMAALEVGGRFARVLQDRGAIAGSVVMALVAVGMISGVIT
jgi:manganese efflux pump family protein